METTDPYITMGKNNDTQVTVSNAGGTEAKFPESVTMGIHEHSPRETSGRDMIGRLNMQFQAAAFAALEILDRKEADRVYCDYHDDFVVRTTSKAGWVYNFYQVKTKGKKNHLWTLAEIFSLKKRQCKGEKDLSDIENSFAGKLFLHSITFGDACGALILLTNIQFNDEVENIVTELRSGDIKSEHAQLLVDRFSEIFKSAASFDRNKAISCVQKIRLEPGIKYIGVDHADFVEAARSAIYKYSEIDLEYSEINEIAANLVSLANKKSFTKLLTTMSPAELDDKVGIGIEDLLAIMSISREVYNAFLSGEDRTALRNASIIQRKMRTAGASDSMIEYCSQQKVQWDIWLRTARHAIPEYDLAFLWEKIQAAQIKWIRQGGAFADLDEHIKTLHAEVSANKLHTLTEELLLGGILAAMVRRGT